jgi:indoleamine 2,3-dioxygenase
MASSSSLASTTAPAMPLEQLPANHFLSAPRNAPLLPGGVDTSTLAAHDFDVDVRTGFMPPAPPLARLPAQWEPWEAALDAAIRGRLQLGIKPGLTSEETAASEAWRSQVSQVRQIRVE